MDRQILFRWYFFSNYCSLRCRQSSKKWSSMLITSVRMLQNRSRNRWTITCWKNHLILPTHLILHHLIFIYWRCQASIPGTWIHGRSRTCFGYLRNFESNSDRYIGRCFWRLDEKVTMMHWYQWRVRRIKIIFLYLWISRITHSGDATVRVEHPV
jgi:hypothetical protein